MPLHSVSSDPKVSHVPSVLSAPSCSHSHSCTKDKHLSALPHAPMWPSTPWPLLLPESLELQNQRCFHDFKGSFGNIAKKREWGAKQSFEAWRQIPAEGDAMGRWPPISLGVVLGVGLLCCSAPQAGLWAGRNWPWDEKMWLELYFMIYSLSRSFQSCSKNYFWIRSLLVTLWNGSISFITKNTLPPQFQCQNSSSRWKI